MLAYRHAFHAGNHADVLKHLVLAQVLAHMAAKDKPYTLIDTHAGAGGYSLEGRYAHTKDEFQSGIGKLWHARRPAAAAGRLRRPWCARSMAAAALEQYPGSPAIANLLLRADDRLHLYELHPTDERILRAFLGQARAHRRSRRATASRRCTRSCRHRRAAAWC